MVLGRTRKNIQAFNPGVWHHRDTNTAYVSYSPCLLLFPRVLLPSVYSYPHCPLTTSPPSGFFPCQITNTWYCAGASKRTRVRRRKSRVSSSGGGGWSSLGRPTTQFMPSQSLPYKHTEEAEYETRVRMEETHTTTTIIHYPLSTSKIFFDYKKHNDNLSF